MICSFLQLRNFAQIFIIARIFAQEINFLQSQNFSLVAFNHTDTVCYKLNHG